MKHNIFRKTALALLSVLILSATLAGCGRSTGEAQSPAPQTNSGTPLAVSAGNESGQMASSVSQEDGGASGAAVPATVPEPMDAAASDAADPNNSAQSGALSGTELTVRFGDDGAPFALHLYDNETAAAIARHVGSADWRLPIYNYDDYENWEVLQYYDIPSRYEIPSNPESVLNEKAGAVYYSEPNRIVLFYGDAEVSGEYTPVGYLDDSQEFIDAVKNNPVLEGWGNKIIHISR